MKLKGILKKAGAEYYSVLLLFSSLLGLFSVSRVFYMVYYFDRIGQAGNFFKIFINGLRTDTVAASYICAVPVIAVFILKSVNHRYADKIWSFFIVFWFCFFITAASFMEIATFQFIKEYDVRPNRLFIEYLVYPKEVLSMLLKGYGFEVFFGVAAVGCITYLSFKASVKYIIENEKSSFMYKLAVFPLIVFLLFTGARSSLGHRPFNPSNVSFSQDFLLNDLGLNSLYSVAYSAYRMRDEGNPAKLYGNMDRKRVFSLVSEETGVKIEDLKSPLRKFIESSGADGKKKNIVIILEESLGAEFVERLGGENLTPELEKLSTQGIWFEKLYATGTRSVRGIEAVISGFPPTPGRSVVKLGKSQTGFFTIADFLSDNGYSTSFIYGGDSDFDNMKRFFLGNGFEKIIDEKDYESPQFRSTWGVSDNDLFVKAHEYFSENQDRPFFSLIFTSSNHSPFEVPDMPEGFYPETGKSVKNAVKYADYALGKFFERAKKSNYWENTVFLVVADHNSRVYGDQLIPVERFRIPGLIIGGGIKPDIYKKTASQIDLPPSLLSIAGLSGYTPMPGNNIFGSREKNFSGRAVLQFYKNQGYIYGDDRLIVLQPGKIAEQYIWTGKSLKKVDTDDNELADKALAFALWTYWQYDKNLYRQDKKDSIAKEIENETAHCRR